MGDRRRQALRVQFDGKIKLRFHGAKITSDAGLLAFRELDEAFRLTEKGSTVLSDRRRGKNTQHTMLAMLRQSVYGRLAGYEDVNDAERLRVDPAMRQVVASRAKEKEAASTSEMSRFEAEMLSPRENLTALMNLSGTWIDSIPGVNPRELPAATGAAAVREALVVDHAAGEADQDRGEDRSARQVRDVPDGRSRGAT